METFHYFIENPRELDLEGIAEHLPPSVQYASVDPIVRVRLLSENMKEDNVAFVNRPDCAALQAHLPFRHHISFRSNHSIQTWLAGTPQTKLIAQVYHNEVQYDLLTVLLRRNPRFREKEKPSSPESPEFWRARIVKRALRARKQVLFACPAHERFPCATIPWIS